MAFNLAVIMLRLYLFRITLCYVADVVDGLLIFNLKNIFLVNVRDGKLNDSPCHFFSSILHFLLFLAGL